MDRQGRGSWRDDLRQMSTSRGDSKTPRPESSIATLPQLRSIQHHIIHIIHIMSAQNSAGIQTLLDAEREAQKIVQKARAYRTQKVKDARSEAQKEIDEYKKQKEAEFKKFESEHTGVNAKAEEGANREVEQKLKEIAACKNEKGPQVIEDLLKAVTEIKPEPHRNSAIASA